MVEGHVAKIRAGPWPGTAPASNLVPSRRRGRAQEMLQERNPGKLARAASGRAALRFSPAPKGRPSAGGRFVLRCA
jgi:hypothetical protein